MQFSFVLLTWNRYRFLELCLKALIGSIQDRDRCEIVVMDNGSTDRTKEVLDRYAGEKNFRVITLDRNYGLEAYKKLIVAARGKYVVVVDDDVLRFPAGVDAVFQEYMTAFPDFGYLALNVVQDEFTNGAKPGPECYTEVTRGGRTLQKGPTGGWCSCFRKWHYQVLRPLLYFEPFSMASSEDSLTVRYMKNWLRLDSGIIRDHTCFHASGPHYALEYGHMDREIEKYKASNVQTLIDEYESYVEKRRPLVDETQR